MVRLSNRALAQIQTMVEQTLTDTCEIQSKVEVNDSYGSTSKQWTVRLTDQPCRVISVGGRGRNSLDEIGAQEAMVESVRLVLPHDVAIHQDERVVVGGHTYAVTGVRDSYTNRVDTQAILSRVRDEK